MGPLRVAEKKQRANQILVKHSLFDKTGVNPSWSTGVMEYWSDVFKPNTPLLLYSNALFRPYLFKWRAG
jgi:hypothetical protein